MSEHVAEGADRPVRGRRWRRFVAAADARLTRDRLVVYPAAVLVLFAVVWVVSLRTSTPLPDFAARWTAGRLVLDDPTRLYDAVTQSEVQRGIGATALSWFVSPPFVALVFVPLGLMPYPFAALLWTAVSLALLAWAARLLAGLHPAFRALATGRGLLVAASCHVVLELVGSGQDSAVVLAALVVGGVLLGRRGDSVLVGLALGVTVVKPQLAALVPVALLLLRAWRALAGFVVTTVVACLAATAVLGMQGWARWLEALTSPLYASAVVEDQAWKNASVRGLVDSLLPGVPPVMTTVVWAAACLAVAGWVAARAPWRHLPPALVMVVLVPLVTVLVSPHAMVYDLVVALPAAVYLVATAGPDARVLSVLAYVLLFLAPVLHAVALAVPTVAPLGAPFVVVPVVGLLWCLLRRSGTDAVTVAPRP